MSAMTKVAKAAIAIVEKLLETLTPEQIIAGHPDLHRPLMFALFKVNTYAAIADLFTQCGYPMTRQNVHRILQQNSELAVKQQRTRTGVKQPLSPEKEQEIVRLFKSGAAITAIAKQLKTSTGRVNSVLDSHGLNLRDRMIANRKVQIGDRFGNWEVIDYVSSETSLCRDVRNGVEKLVTNQALRLGKSTGCKELAIAGWKAKTNTEND